MKLPVLQTLVGLALLATLNACSASSQNSGGTADTPSSPSPASTEPTKSAEPTLPGKVGITVYNENGDRVYVDGYENTKSGPLFRCFYDKTGTQNALRLTGYNPESKSPTIKRFVVSLAGNYVLKEGANDLKTTAGNSIITFDEKAPVADRPLYRQVLPMKAAMDGCRASVIVEGPKAKGQVFCSEITDSAFKPGSSLEMEFNCQITTVEAEAK